MENREAKVPIPVYTHHWRESYMADTQKTNETVGRGIQGIESATRHPVVDAIGQEG